MIKNNNFDFEHQSKLLKRYNKYYNGDKLQWNIPQHEMKNIISECWNLSRTLTKHKSIKIKDGKCPLGLDAPTVCQFCVYGKMSNEDYEYRCNYDKDEHK